MHGKEVLTTHMVACHGSQFSNSEAKFQLLKYLETSIHTIKGTVFVSSVVCSHYCLLFILLH